MRKIFAILLIQTVTCTVFAAAVIKAPLFKVEKNGQTAYMLGTIHTGIDFSALPDQLKTIALDESDSLIVETDINQGQFEVAQAFPPGAKDSLRDQLTAEEWATFTSVIEPLLGPQANFVMDRLHPVVATAMYGAAGFPKTLEPIDQYLVLAFDSAAKPIYFFEDIQVQINIMKETQTIDTLKQQMMITPEQVDQQSQMMLFIYGSGDLNLIEQFLVSPMAADQLQLLLTDRNLAWQSNFDELFNKPGQEFFAFGAGHLPGRLGMVQLVRDLGYTVTQVQF